MRWVSEEVVETRERGDDNEWVFEWDDLKDRN